MKKFFRHSVTISNRDGVRIPMHVIDKPLGKGENPGLLVRSAGKQLYDPDDGLLAGAWPMDEATGLFVRDHGNAENHGLITGAMWVNDGLTFNGTSQHVALGSANFNYEDNFTIIAWINTTSWPGGLNTIFGKWYTDYENYMFYIDSSGKITFYGDGVDVVGNTAILSGTTHLVAAVINGEESRVYRDGVVDSDKFVHTRKAGQGDAVAFIGATGAVGTGGEFTGNIYLCAIYSRALSAAEMKAIYDVGLYRRTESYRVPNA